MLSKEDFELCSGKESFKEVLKSKLKKSRYDSLIDVVDYGSELLKLQAELVDLQQWAAKHKKRVCVLFEGRDAAGKGGAIRRFTEHLNPRSMRVVALTKPTEIEKGQWYFRRYIKELPEPGELVFFDRSWYNRAVVEPVMDFCTDEEYNKFMLQVPEFEHMLYEDGVIIIKFWFSISKEDLLYSSIIYKQLLLCKKNYLNTSIIELKNNITKNLTKSKKIEIDYFEFIELATLKAITVINKETKYAACIAVKISGVRLIDNIIL